MSDDDSSLALGTEEDVEVGKVTGLTIPPSVTLPLPPKPPSPERKTERAKDPTEPKYYERLINFLENAERKRKVRKEAMMQREEEACTFAPKLVSKQREGRGKTMEEMYEDAIAKGKELQHRREAAEEQERQSIGPFRPSINAQSAKLAGGKRDQTDLFTFLHRTKTTERGRKGYEPQKHTFTPRINRKSEVLFREKTIEELLMEDAEKRLARKSSVPSLPLQEKLISTRSEKVLSDKFSSEFVSALQQVTSSQTLTKPQLYEVLRLLHFTKGVVNPLIEELWESLSAGIDGVETKVLFSLLAAILRLPVSESSNSLSPRAIDRIHQSFKPLYDTRQSAVAKSSQNRTFKFSVSYPFQPDTTKSAYFLLSQNTDRVALQKTEVEEYLRDKRTEAAEKGDKAKPESLPLQKNSLLGKYMKIAKGTVKRPQDRNEALYRLAEQEQKHRENLKAEDFASHGSPRKGPRK